MKPLSKEASAALNALKAADPAPEDEARVRKNVERALGVAIPVAGVAAATTATTAKAATGLLSSLGVGAKVAVVVVVASTVAVTTLSLSSKGGEGRGEEQLKPAPARIVTAPPENLSPSLPEGEREREKGSSTTAPEVVAVAPLPAKPKPQPKPTEPPPPEPTPAPIAEVDAPTPPPPPPSSETWDLEVEANFPSCDAATELRSAQRARQLLDADRAEDAVWLLGAYQRRCASGRWSNEAWSVRMAGLCKLNRTAEVIGLLQWFSSEYPTRRAAVLSELRSFCPDEVLSPSPRGGEGRGEGIPTRE